LKQNFTSARNDEFLQSYRVKIGFNPLSFWGVAIDFLTTAIDLYPVNLPTFAGDFVDKLSLGLP